MTSNLQLFDQLSLLLTEQRNPATTDIDSQSTFEILKSINGQDKLVPLAVERELPHIAAAVEIIVGCIKGGGRLIYVGAGTSGRLGVLDAVECPPTFGTSPDLITGLIAGGKEAMFRSVEGAEDNTDQVSEDLAAVNPKSGDVVCGIAASRRTPYVVIAIERSRALGARTIYITTNPRSEFNIDVDVAICPEVGPEVIMGSTRMKSGTAQKLVLNMLTTASMIRLGKVYENMMVDLQLTNQKLVERAKRIVMTATGATYEQAAEVLQKADGHVKTAIVMMKLGVDGAVARKKLDAANGFVREALKPE